MTAPFIPQGVIPAVLLPFDSDLKIDESSYRRHLRDVLAVAGISAITTNAHASEVHALSVDEQRKVLDITLEEVGEAVPTICGIYADGSQQAAALARQAQAGGARCLLVFPSNVFGFGAIHRPDMVITHFSTIAEATDLPMIVFVYPISGGLGYTTETIIELCGRIPNIVAIKDWCNNPVQHERNIRSLHALTPQRSVVTTHSAWLMSSLVMGVDGLLSGAGSVIADVQLELWKAVRNGDLTTAQRINDRIWPITEVFYTDPFVDMHNRMKEALVLLGRQAYAHVRPPLTKLGEREILRIREGLIRGGLLRQQP